MYYIPASKSIDGKSRVRLWRNEEQPSTRVINWYDTSQPKGLKQASIAALVEIEEKHYLVIAFARPHQLDIEAGLVKKKRGREIAAGRLAGCLRVITTLGNVPRDAPPYVRVYSVVGKDVLAIIKVCEALQKDREKQAPYEKFSRGRLAVLYRKLKKLGPYIISLP